MVEGSLDPRTKGAWIAQQTRGNSHLLKVPRFNTPACLWGPGGGTALDYLRGRGLTEATVRAAGLGFTPAVMIPTRAGDRCFRFSGIVIPWRVEAESGTGGGKRDRYDQRGSLLVEWFFTF